MLRHALPRAAAAIALFGLIAATAGPLAAQPAPTKKVLTFADYDIWRTAAGVTLSRDGTYVAYLVGSEAAEGEAVVRNVATGKELRFPRGIPTTLPNGAVVYGTPKFTPDGKRVLLPLTVTKTELEKAKTDKLKIDEYPKAALAIIDFASGTELDRITGFTSFQVAGEGAGFVIYRKGTAPEAAKTDAPAVPGKGIGKGGKGGFQPGGKADAPAKTTGTDLYIRDLTSTVARTIADVTEFSLSNDEKTLVYMVSGKTEEKNGVYAMNPRFGTAATPVKAGPGRYSGLTWDEKQAKLAFFYDDSAVPSDSVAPPPRPAGTPEGTPAVAAPAPTVPPRWRVFVWDRLAKAEISPAARIPAGTAGAGLGTLVAPAVAANAPAPTPSPLSEVFGPDAPGMKKGWAISTSGLSFSLDGTKLYVSTAPERAPAVVGPPAADDVQLDIWHWKDAAIQPMQKVRATADRNRTYGAVVLLDTKQFRQLSDDGISVTQPGSGDWAVATDDRKYRHMTGYASPVPSDTTLVNVRTGATLPLATAATFGLSMSPNGKYLIGFDGKDWQTVAVPDGKKANLTAKVGAKFFNEEHDTPDEAPSYGGAQWTTDGKSVLVSDRFDIWKLAADGSTAENLTKTGRAQGVRFTLLRPRARTTARRPSGPST